MINRLPDEILLALFAEFHISALFAARGACRKWRNLLSVAALLPSRKSLLEIYLEIITEPWFIEGRPWVLRNLKSFDRQAYIDALPNQHHYVPEDFRIWILEWPANAVFGGLWPGLPEIIEDEIGPIRQGRRGWNMLNTPTPRVWTIKHINSDDVDLADHVEEELVELLPAMPIFHNPGGQTFWLLLDSGKSRDQVLFSGTIPDEFSACDGPDELRYRWSNWIDYLKDDKLVTYKRRYSRITSGLGKRYHVNGLVPPEPLRMSYVPWIPEQESYMRPAEYLSDRIVEM